MSTVKTYNISRILVGNKIADYSDAVGESHVGSTLASMDWVARRYEKHFNFGIWCYFHQMFDSISFSTCDTLRYWNEYQHTWILFVWGSALNHETVLDIVQIVHFWRHGVFLFLNTLGWDKMDTFTQTTISHAFSRPKMFQFRLKCHWILFCMVQFTQFTIFHNWFR